MRVLMTGGGTGGHVNPAIAIANYIRENEKGSEIAFVGTSKGIENKLAPKYGYEVYHVEIQGLKRSLSLSNLKTFYLAVTSVSKAKKIVKQFKPDVVIGTGGYVCWPVVKAASELGIPTVLHESNALAGVAVRMLEKYVDIIYTNFEATISQLKYPSKAQRVGNPLMTGDNELGKDDAKRMLGLEKYDKVLLSYGGSLGAERINSEMLYVMENYSALHGNVFHIHASGAIEKKVMFEAFKQKGLDKYENIRLEEYIYDMPVMMAAADLVICRSGAMTLSELAMQKKAAILIPSPNVTDNHQYKNAHELEKVGAAVLFEEKNLEEGVLRDKIEELLSDDKKTQLLRENISDFAVRNATERIYSGVKELISRKKH